MGLATAYPMLSTQYRVRRITREVRRRAAVGLFRVRVRRTSRVVAGRWSAQVSGVGCQVSGEAALCQVGDCFEVGLSASQYWNGFDFEEAVGRGDPKIRDADLAQLIADFFGRLRQWRVDDDQPFALAF